MPLSPWLIGVIALIPMAVALIGGLIPSFYVPKPRLTSFLQHFVAGIVVGAVSVELLPKIVGRGEPITIGIGFILGVIAVLVIHEVTHLLEAKGNIRTVPVGLVIGSAIDLFIDGLLIGLSFLAGQASGLYIAIALGFCAFFLNFSISATMKQMMSARWLQISSIILVAVMLPIGATVGSYVVNMLPKTILVETLAFGVAALLYLGVEELLGKAHEEHDTPWISASFFFGFLVILLFRF